MQERYDVDGARVKKVSGGTTTYTFFGHYEEEVTSGVTTAVSHYSFGGLRVAVKRGSTLYHVHGDHLGSTSVTTAGSVVEGSRAYYPYGAQRSASGTLRTDRTFTGQKEDGTGLLYYNARYYDPTLGTFISPDSVVPDPGMVVDYNRFLYTRGNPLKYGDPSGSASAEWEAMNNWYNARGWFHNPRSRHWDLSGNPRIRTRESAEEVLNDAGIVKFTGFTDDSELILLAEGIAKFAQTIGNLNNLNGALGEMAGLARLQVLTMNRVSWHRVSDGYFSCAGVYACAAEGSVAFYDKLFAKGQDFVRGTAVHEIAHVIDSFSCHTVQNMAMQCLLSFDRTSVSTDLPGWAGGYGKLGHRTITRYGDTNQREYWAEAVADWVYEGAYRPGSLGRSPISQAQRTYLMSIFYDPAYNALQKLTMRSNHFQ